METTLITRLRSIDCLIRMQHTGNAREMAERLGITERSVYNYLHLMKAMGAPIVFSPYRQSYVYKGDGRFFIGFLNDLEPVPVEA